MVGVHKVPAVDPLSHSGHTRFAVRKQWHMELEPCTSGQSGFQRSPEKGLKFSDMPHGIAAISKAGRSGFSDFLLRFQVPRAGEFLLIHLCSHVDRERQALAQATAVYGQQVRPRWLITTRPEPHKSRLSIKLLTTLNPKP